VAKQLRIDLPAVPDLPEIRLPSLSRTTLHFGGQHEEARQPLEYVLERYVAQNDQQHDDEAGRAQEKPNCNVARIMNGIRELGHGVGPVCPGKSITAL
jgi:hypothetical protein